MAGKIDKSIQQLITMFGDCTKIEKLWENASPSSNFSGQQINLPAGFDRSKYLFYIFVYNISTSYTRKIVTLSNGSWYNMTQYIGNITNSSKTAFFLERGGIVTVKDSVPCIVFDACDVRQGNSVYQTTEYLIPYRVYGVRGK